MSPSRFAALADDLVLDPLLCQREEHLVSLARIERALTQHQPRPSRLTRQSLINLHTLIREEVHRLEEAWCGQGPSRN